MPGKDTAHANGIVAGQLMLSDTYRWLSSVYRRSFPSHQALEAFAKVVYANLPDTVTSLRPGE